MPRFPHGEQRLFLNGQQLDDWKELSDYGITAATASKLKLSLMMVSDPRPARLALLPCRRRDEDGARCDTHIHAHTRVIRKKDNVQSRFQSEVYQSRGNKGKTASLQCA